MAKLTELLLVSIPVLIYAHLFLSPYTKVEESFNIQAAHDILKYVIPPLNKRSQLWTQYDHFTFPGAVPRTFVGALVLAGFAKPLLWLNSTLPRQLLVRGIVGTFNALALISYARGVRRAFGRDAALWYTLFQASQFHVIYYASRTLPNMFAFGITTFALRYTLPEPTEPGRAGKRYRLCLYFLTIAGIVFRSEIALFLGCITIYHWIRGDISLVGEVIPAGISGVLVALLTSVPIDSLFWQRYPLWPEMSAFIYNVVSGNASAWGVSPWHFYFTSALPRLLLNPLTYLLAIPLSLSLPARRRAATTLFLPSLAYIALYSLQPHKEWRFIIYTIPPLTTTAALGASYIWTHSSKSALYKLLSLPFILSTLATFLISNFLLLPASMANYPGAHALNVLHAHAHDTKRVISVHLDNLACQTGVTHFLEMEKPESPLVMLPGSKDGRFPTLKSGSSEWVYDRSENETEKSLPRFWRRFDYVVVAEEEGVRGGEWEVVEEVRGFGGIGVLRPGDEGAGGRFESDLVRKIMGDGGVKTWEGIKENMRKYVTRGWWAEVRMVPKLKILKRVK